MRIGAGASDLGIQRREVRTRAHDRGDEALLQFESRTPRRDHGRFRRMPRVRRQVATLEPAREPSLLDRHGECLVERGVARHVHDLVREFMEQRADRVFGTAAQHRTDVRIGESPQRRVRGDAADRDVVALACESRSERARLALVEIPR